jgi:hypothetical protein
VIQLKIETQTTTTTGRERRENPRHPPDDPDDGADQGDEDGEQREGQAQEPPQRPAVAVAAAHPLAAAGSFPFFTGENGTCQKRENNQCRRVVQ